MNMTKAVFEDVIVACTEGATFQLEVPAPAEQTSVLRQQQHQVQQASDAITHATRDHHHRTQQVNPNKWRRFLPLYCHCGRTVRWQHGSSLCGRQGDSRRHTVYQEKINCCHCRQRFEFTLNKRQITSTYCPYKRACPLCKAVLHSAVCLPAPKTIVSVH